MSHIDVKSQHLGLVVVSDSGISTRARTHHSDFTNNSIDHKPPYYNIREIYSGNSFLSRCLAYCIILLIVWFLKILRRNDNIETIFIEHEQFDMMECKV